MKILIVGDVHWSQYSSIIRDRTERFSVRLENLIQSVNWAESISQKYDCSLIVYLGDFFDRAELNAEEITALNHIEWDNEITHYFICGNHEMGDKYHKISSAKIFELKDNFVVIDKPTILSCHPFEIHFIPYMPNDIRKPFSEYCAKEYDKSTKIYVMSHNDLQMQYGEYKSVNGFTIDEIEGTEHCKRFFNGHLHNRSNISVNAENVGNLTGQNFSEDALIYKHGVVIYDTDTDTEQFIENPYAFNFYKLTENHILGNPCLGCLDNNAIVSMSCKEENYDIIKDWLGKYSLISRIQVQRILSENSVAIQEELIKIDHLAKFKEYINSILGNDELVQSEIGEVTV